jgi:peroxiredoxin (alkyl hydroperoxide reductase subunit C)
MSVLVGHPAPNFSSPALVQGQIQHNFSLTPYLGQKYVLLFFYPKDFTGVCSSELVAFNKRLAEFEARETAVVSVSTDSVEAHEVFTRLTADQGGIGPIDFPMVSDLDKSISTNYDVLFGEYEYDENNQLHANGPMIALRGLFIIDKEGVVQHQLVNNFVLGRSVDEALRMVDVVRHFKENGEVCPADWTPGA